MSYYIDRNKVLIVRKKLLPISETFILDQARTLKKWDAVLSGFKLVNGGLDLSGAVTHVVQGVTDNYYNNLIKKIRFFFNREIPVLVKYIQNEKFDLVHVHFGVDAVDVFPSIKSAGIPMIVTLHGYDIDPNFVWWRKGKAGYRRVSYPGRLLRMAADPDVHFIAVSEHIRRRALSQGIPESKVSQSYIGVDLDKFYPQGKKIADRDNVVLYVGRLVPNKCPFLLIKAVANIANILPDVRLIMIGTGPLFGEVQRLASSLGDFIEVLGAQSSWEVRDYLHYAKVLCLPSNSVESGASEGLGQVLLEAQACGVPVVGANIGGIPEAILHGETGYLFNPGDGKDLQEKLLMVLAASKESQNKMSSRARAFVENKFDLRNRTRDLERIYSSLRKTEV